ncbi:putative Zinc finger, BED-type [Corchorus olitorius]|uniref:Zinc finger, BED-type n=1 Tax=Corchorus olitorius TaxID=93759 RepID=A0A1R3G4S6_9ROSI|nr:putative Zinc finger, BED-type [Corchorus olitorius]
MTKLECEDKALLKAQCNHCKTILCAKSSSGTSHLKHHLEGCILRHNKSIKQYSIATQPTLGGGSVIKNYKYDQEECRRAVLIFLACGKHSFKTVEEPGFRYLMSVASGSYNNISRHTASRDVLNYYAKERELVKEELAKAPGRYA